MISPMQPYEYKNVFGHIRSKRLFRLAGQRTVRPKSHICLAISMKSFGKGVSFPSARGIDHQSSVYLTNKNNITENILRWEVCFFIVM